MARIAVIGPGAIGGTMAAWLSQSGEHRVFLCVRSPLENLQVATPQGVIAAMPTVLLNPAEAPAVDWVLVTTKAYDSAAAASWFPGLVAEGARVAVLQNGVEHRERFAAFVPHERLLPVMVDCPAERTAPGRIRQRGTAVMAVPDEALGHAFVALFAGTPVEIALSKDFLSTVWRKLCVNCAGVLSGLLLQPAGVLRDEALGDVARQLVRECIAVARAEGAVIEDEWADGVVQGYRNAPPDSINSLHGDRLAGRPTEIDARNGVIVRRGRVHGIATPANQMAVALLLAQEAAERAKA